MHSMMCGLVQPIMKHGPRSATCACAFTDAMSDKLYACTCTYTMTFDCVLLYRVWLDKIVYYNYNG